MASNSFSVRVSNGLYIRGTIARALHSYHAYKGFEPAIYFTTDDHYNESVLSASPDVLSDFLTWLTGERRPIFELLFSACRLLRIPAERILGQAWAERYQAALAPPMSQYLLSFSARLDERSFLEFSQIKSIVLPPHALRFEQETSGASVDISFGELVALVETGALGTDAAESIALENGNRIKIPMTVLLNMQRLLRQLDDDRIPKATLDSIGTRSALKFEFSEDFSPDEVVALIGATGDLFRATGGMGFKIKAEYEEIRKGALV